MKHLTSHSGMSRKIRSEARRCSLIYRALDSILSIAHLSVIIIYKYVLEGLSGAQNEGSITGASKELNLISEVLS